MTVVCAWCRVEGQPGVLAEKEPRGDGAETHGICVSHGERVRAVLRARALARALAGVWHVAELRLTR